MTPACTIPFAQTCGICQHPTPKPVAHVRCSEAIYPGLFPDSKAFARATGAVQEKCGTDTIHGLDRLTRPFETVGLNAAKIEHIHVLFPFRHDE